MSYCRFSCDGYRSDVYAYVSNEGWYIVHVACYKFVFPDNAPEAPACDPNNPDEWFNARKDYEKFLLSLDKVEIAGPCDGKTFILETEAELFDELRWLREQGYHVPEHAFVSEVDDEA